MIVFLTGYKPLPRADQPWTHARIEEGPTAAGPWTEIVAAYELDPVDVDPLEPADRAFTITTAALLHGWYVVTFVDADDGEQPTEPVPGDEVAAGMLASVADFKRYLHSDGRLSDTPTVDEQLLWDLLAAASDRMRDARSDRTLAPEPPDAAAPEIERRFPAERTVALPDLREVTEVLLDDRELAPTDYTLRARHGEPAVGIRLTYWPAGARELIITGRWGPDNVKPAVREACIAWAARAFHQRTARFADNVPTPAGGVLGYFRNLPPDVKRVLNDLWEPGL